MSNATFSVVSNAYGFAFGVLSLLGCAIGMCRSHLPSRKIQALEDLLEQTRGLFHSAIEAGLLPDHGFRTRTEARLERLREDIFQVRAEAYASTTLYSDYKAFFRGLSFAIAKRCSDLKEVRANVITTSEKYRLRRNALPQTAAASEPENAPLNTEIISSCGGVPVHVSITTEYVAESVHKPACGSRQRSRSCPPDLRYCSTHSMANCLCLCRDSTTVIHESSTDSLNTLVIEEPLAEISTIRTYSSYLL